LFKHSNACPVSFSAYDEVRAWADANPDARVGYVVIQVNRQLSNLIAGILQRVHQSPQLFLVADGAASFHASHWSITAGAMDKAWGEAAR
jgi:bacillithiol system protein YtxJ